MNFGRDWWISLNAKYAALSHREKILVAAAIILTPLLIGEMLFADPQRNRLTKLKTSIVQQSATTVELRTQLQSLQHRLQIDPDAGALAELVALKDDQVALENRLRQLDGRLVRPEQMNSLLERLLSRHAGLRLLSLRTLKPQSVLGDIEGRKKETEGERFDLYQHGVEIRLEGSFADLQSYLLQLERSPQRLLWGELKYEVRAYPKAEMRLMVYTLSADRSWLAI
jgi:MSHA biogenesis protein MshJ